MRRFLFIAGIALWAMSCGVSHGENDWDHFDGTHFFNAEDAAGKGGDRPVEKPKWPWLIWSERASIVSWARPKRVRAPGVDINNLPRIDVILISHNHYDHLDIATFMSRAG